MSLVNNIFNRMPVGIKYLLYANLIVFVLQILTPITGIVALYPFDSGRYHLFQFITYQFSHGGFLHILFNMLALVTILPVVEYKIGTKKFVIFYLICGVFGALTHMTLINSTVPLVGASAAIWGMFVMFTLFNPDEELYLFLIPIPIKAKYLIGGLFVIELYCSIVGTSDGIGHLAHIGGAITGIILFFVNKYILSNRYYY